MNKDFTIQIYKDLLVSFVEADYSFQTYRDFTEHPKEKVILLRHDVDARKEHSLQFAKIQHDLGIVGTYYFRIVPESFDEDAIREISSMGHEIGYHYEDMDFANGDVDKAYQMAKDHLAQLRKVADVKTICMHGSPRSPYDNKEVWKNYDYRDLGIIAEPYFDLDFSKVLYLTDTGRRWDGEKVSVRDKVQGAGRKAQGAGGRGEAEVKSEKGKRNRPQSQNALTNKRINESTNKPLSENYSFHSTQVVINACKSGILPNQIMMNFHPQRWSDDPILWTRELVWQNMKNVVKAGIVKFKG